MYQVCYLISYLRYIILPDRPVFISPFSVSLKLPVTALIESIQPASDLSSYYWTKLNPVYEDEKYTYA